MIFRSAKRVIVFIVIVFIVIVFSIVGYFVIKPNPTCEDEIQNQGEEKIDCGGPCNACPTIIKLEKLKLVSTEWAYDIDNKYDLVFKLHNPNSDFGAAGFRYRAIIEGQAEDIFETNWGEGFILPGEKKFLFLTGVRLENKPEKISFEVLPESVEWKKFEDYKEPRLVITNDSYAELSGGKVNFSQAKGTLVNKSSIDFEEIVVKVLLRDENGKLLAINHQVMNTIRSNEYRDYVINFPHEFSGSVRGVETEMETNVFNSKNYIRIHGIPKGRK